jgi:hypothetical protein
MRDRDVRGSVASTPWEENAHAHDNAVRHRSWGYALHRDPPKRSSGVVKRSIPPVMPFGAQDSEGRPRCESGESEPGTHEVRVHAVRLGGRHRLDASRVFHAGSSQGLVVLEGR